MLFKLSYATLEQPLTSGGICRFLLLIKKDVRWFPLKRFVDLVRVRYLQVISRNHSNTLLLINLQKPKACSK